MDNQFPGMRDFHAAYRADLIRGNCNHSSGPAREGHKLYLIGFVPRINVNHRANVTRLQALVLQRRGQNNSIVLVDHALNILNRMGRDQPGNCGVRIDDPDGSDHGGTPVRTGKRTVNAVFRAVFGLVYRNNWVRAGMEN